MGSLIDKLKWGFLAAFVVACAGVAAYQWWWVRPAERCEQSKRWWDAETRTCASPVFLSDITGRRTDAPRSPDEVAAARAKTTLRQASDRTPAR